MLLRQSLHNLSQRLRLAGTDAPNLCARLLAAHVLGCDKNTLVLHTETELSAQQEARLNALGALREQGQPLAYILGQREFFGRNFAVTPATLIPRPESEDVLEACLRALSGHGSDQQLFFADVGTGSGCLGVSLACEIPRARGILLDLSLEALHVAKENAQRHKVATRLSCVRGDLRALPLPAGSLDLLISNPPYVSGPEYAELDKGVREYEPCTALTPDAKEATGLPHLAALARQAHNLLRARGICIVEHGCEQGLAVRDLFAAQGAWKQINTGIDLAGRPRFCLCHKE